MDQYGESPYTGTTTAARGSQLNIPGNILPWVEDAADAYGIPVAVLASMIYQESRWNGLDDAFGPALIFQAAEQLRSSFDQHYWGDDDVDPNSLTAWAYAAASYARPDNTQGYMNAIFSNLGLRTDDITDTYWDNPENQQALWVYAPDKTLASETSKHRLASFPGGIGGFTVGGAAPAGSRPATISDIYDLFQNYLGRPPKNDEEAIGYGRVGRSLASIAQELENSPEGKAWREGGQAITASRSWATGMFREYFGRDPTNDELRTVMNNGWTPQQLEMYLRAQPYGNTKATVGAVTDLRSSMNRAAIDILGRDATPEEINWAVVNGIPANHATAFYEQVRDKTVWGVNPDKYRTFRTLVQQTLKNYGITAEERDIDPTIVNRAAEGNWSDAQVRAAIGQMQAPGQAPGVTIEKYASTRDMGERLYGTYFPGENLPDSIVATLVNLTPDQMREYVRSLPSRENPAIQAGAYHDAKLVAGDILGRVGVVGRMPRPNEIAIFANTGMNAEAIDAYYRNLPELLAENPGLPYNLSAEEYKQKRSAIESAYTQMFGSSTAPATTPTPTPGTIPSSQAAGVRRLAAPPPGAVYAGGSADGSQVIYRMPDGSFVNVTPGVSPSPVQPVIAAPGEPAWMKALLQEGFSSEETRDVFADYFKRLGRAPSPDEIRASRTRPKFDYRERIAGEIGRPTELGPTLGGLGGPGRGPAI